MSIKTIDKKQKIKIITLGPKGAGKTSLLKRIFYDRFQQNQMVTLGMEYFEKNLQINNQSVKLECYDTAGQEIYNSLSKLYYRGTHGVFLAFDITDEDSFKRVQTWLKIALEETINNTDIYLLLIGCKSDLEQQRKISVDVAQSYAQNLGMNYIQTSAKTSKNCQVAFDFLCMTCLEKRNQRSLQENEYVAIKQNYSQKSRYC
ncbi:unnamed protein product [Paramecium pentaurelia]|uniref:Uncharacterized protein n=1 Tax=Paramecium pentaurelia TaxID=43138 RepID=A0A8S1WUE8_9CILI|nr:unnamed protein product [Paramecium pentaurelia]